MTPLATVFERHLPAMLKKRAAASPGSGSIGFVAKSGPERGFWVVSLDEGTSRRGDERDEPRLVVEGDAAVLVLLFSGGLDVGRAVDTGALTLRGDAGALAALAAVLS
jgi:hypothetical protein